MMVGSPLQQVRQVKYAVDLFGCHDSAGSDGPYAMHIMAVSFALCLLGTTCEVNKGRFTVYAGYLCLHTWTVGTLRSMLCALMC